MQELNTIIQGDTLTELRKMASDSVDLVITSPPYWKTRNYQVEGQLGQESDYLTYLDCLIHIMAELKRVVKPTGSIYFNIADVYNTPKKGNTNGIDRASFHMKEGINTETFKKETSPSMPKGSLMNIPARFAIACTDELKLVEQNEIIWFKRNAFSSGGATHVRYGNDYEPVYFFTKTNDYYFKTQYEPLAESTMKELEQRYLGQATKDYEAGGAQNPSDAKRSTIESLKKMIDQFLTTDIRWGGKKQTDANGGTYSGKVWKVPTRPGINPGENSKWTEELQDPAEKYHAKDESTRRMIIIRELNGKLFGKAKRSVWNVTVKGYHGAHIATFPPDLIEPMMLASCPPGGIVLDPFMGAGTTGLVAIKNGFNFLGIELNPEYIAQANKRIYPNGRQIELPKEVQDLVKI